MFQSLLLAGSSPVKFGGFVRFDPERLLPLGRGDVRWGSTANTVRFAYAAGEVGAWEALFEAELLCAEVTSTRCTVTISVLGITGKADVLLDGVRHGGNIQDDGVFLAAVFGLYCVDEVAMP